MSLEIMTDPRVRAVEWRDLASLSRAQTARELILFVPWVASSWLLAAQGWWIAALGCSFVFFLVGLRIVHDAHHHNLGLSRRGDDAVMAFLSVLMLSSMHAVQFNHLRHHRHCMDDEDLEAWSARLPGYKAILFGPAFPVMLHHAALVKGTRRVRRWTLVELSLGVAWIASVLLVFDVAFLKYHVLVMLIGQCFTAFFAVWTVHHDCDRSHFIARTIRGRFKTAITYNMFYHVEHHLFPGVPTRNLPTLASRLDKTAPELQSHTVF